MLIVPYTHGSASPTQIAEACHGRAELAFLIDAGDRRVAPLVPMLRELAPVVTHDEDLSCVLEKVASLKPRGIVTFSDSKLRLTAAIAEGCGLRYNSPATCGVLRSKLRQRQCLNASNVGRVNVFEFTLGDPEAVSVPAGARFPAIIKPEEGAASRDTILVPSKDDLAVRLSELPPGRTYVFEEYIRGANLYAADWLADYVSVESAVSEGEIRHLGVTARLPLAEPVRESGAVFSVIPEEKKAAAVLGLAERAIGATGITTGLVHTEIKMAPGGPQVIEVNGRLGGTMERLIPRAGGINPVRLAVDIALGAPLPHDFGEPGRLAMMIFVQPPMNATAVEKMPSSAELHKLPGVFGVDRLAKDGRPVDWRIGTLGRICDIWIDAASLEELEGRYHAVIDALDNGISWRYN